MKIEIKDGEELKNTVHALMQAIRYVNDKLKSSIDSSHHPEWRSTAWWSNFKSDVDIARTLSALLDKLEQPQNKE